MIRNKKAYSTNSKKKKKIKSVVGDGLEVEKEPWGDIGLLGASFGGGSIGDCVGVREEEVGDEELLDPN